MSSGNGNENRARIVSREELEACGKRLRSGELVAFPTETVYGLGCHALDPDAVRKVFQAKERPFTDPLIVHVTSTEAAMNLWDRQQDEGAAALVALTKRFWPGPLTLVAKAAPHVPPILMANTGFVACRSPSHPLARALIDEAKVPIAAPSANKFGHVSPTRAQHVYDDLKDENVWIVDAPSVCSVGVESTVAKLTIGGSNGDGVVTVLRQGAISTDDIETCLIQAGLHDSYRVEKNTERAVKEHVATVAPGQTIRHYSPNIASFMVSPELYGRTALSPQEQQALSTTIVLDFGGRIVGWKEYCLAYRDLSATGNSTEAASAVFESLRWAEQVPQGTRILFPELAGGNKSSDDALALALKDRLTRAASGEAIRSLV